MAKDTTVCAGRLFLLVDCAVACTGQILVPVSEDRKVAVRSEMVSLLEGPGLPHPIAAQVPLGTILKVQGRNREEDWIRVLHEGQALWIFADYIDLTPDKLDALPVVPGRGPSWTAGPARHLKSPFPRSSPLPGIPSMCGPNRAPACPTNNSMDVPEALPIQVQGANFQGVFRYTFWQSFSLGHRSPGPCFVPKIRQICGKSLEHETGAALMHS